MSTFQKLELTREKWRPPDKLSLTEWAKLHYYLSAESSAEPGRWRPWKFQVGIMDALSDPKVWKVTWKKSARVGATKIMNGVVGYYTDLKPCPILIVQPTVDDAEGYSKEEIAPMIRDCPNLAKIFGGDGRAKTTQDTILHKIYAGGSISMVGANSGRGLRRVSRKVVCLDEVDAYPASAGSDGDPVMLAIRRTEHYHDRLIYLASTPLTEGASRISEEFEKGDMRFFYVPCPHCGHMDQLLNPLDQRENGGHWMRWPESKPEEAHFVCSDCGCEIEHKDKREMVDSGEWRASKEFDGHASFHIWAAYSYSPNASWEQIAIEFDEATEAGPDKLRTVVNTVFGQCFQEQGDAPNYEILMARCEDYGIGTVPEGVEFITCGVDVQKERLVYEVVGWGYNHENWSIDQGQLLGSTSEDAVWDLLEDLLTSDWKGSGGSKKIRLMAVDSGYNTQTVYNWCRKFPMSQVMAVKGIHTQKVLVNAPSKVDVNFRGKKIGYKLWPVGPGVAKGEIYSKLDLKPGEDGAFPKGYCHFPDGYGQGFFMELTSEHLVTVPKKDGRVELVWKVLPKRENHFLDCRVYARCAAAVAGLDRMKKRPQGKVRAPQPEEDNAEKPARREKPLTNGGGFLRGGRGRGKGGGSWLKR